jgi:hypothetical protein
MSDSTTALGLMAAGIAVFGFLAHAKSALAGRDEAELRRLTVAGGVVGWFTAVALILVSIL